MNFDLFWKQVFSYKINHFLLSLSHYSKFYGRIFDSFEFQKFLTQTEKMMAKDKKVNIAVSYLKQSPGQTLRVGS